MTCYLQYICVLYSKWSFGETYLGICQQLYDGFPKPQQQRKTYQQCVDSTHQQLEFTVVSIGLRGSPYTKQNDPINQSPN